LKELQSLDPNAITPLEALKLVHQWKRRVADQPNAPAPEPAAKPRSNKAASGKPANPTPSLFD